jgi:hypothetical protein
LCQDGSSIVRAESFEKEENVGRRRIGDGPSSVLIGRFLTTLLAHAEQTGGGGGAAGITADDLAQRLGITASEARVVASELARSGCLRIGRMPNGRSRNGGRYAQSVSTPAPGEQRGISRQPRVRAVGLMIEGDNMHAEQLGRMLREEGLVPVAVPNTCAALMLLKMWGFELVVLDCATRQHPLSASELAQVQKLAREAGCGPMLLLGGPEDLRGLANANGNPLARVRLAGRDREQARLAVAEVAYGAMNTVTFGSMGSFA